MTLPIASQLEEWLDKHDVTFNIVEITVDQAREMDAALVEEIGSAFDRMQGEISEGNAKEAFCLIRIANA